MAQAAVAQRRGPSTARRGIPMSGVLAGGGIVSGGALMLPDVPTAGIAACTVPPLVLVGFSRWRSAKRRAVREDLEESLTPLLGSALTVKCSRWEARAFIHPRPRRIKITYSAGARDFDPKWLRQLLATVDARVGVEYAVEFHRSERKVIVLSTKEQEEDELDDSPKAQLQQRAAVTVTETLGKQSQAAYQWSGEELEGIDVTIPDEIAVKLHSRMKRQQIERVITAMLPGRWRARWDIESTPARAHFEIRPSIPEGGVVHPPPVITDENRYLIPTGVTEDGETTVWDLKSTVPHGLTTGKTGTGKTVDILGIVMEWTCRSWAAWIADPKQIEFIGMRKWPNVQAIAVTVEEQMALIVRAWNLMEQRYAQIVAGADERDFEPLLLVLDEYTDLRSAITHWWAENKPKGGPAKCPIFGMIGSLARKARSAKIHLLFGLQRPDAEILSGEVRDNLGFRHSLGRLSPEGARMMWGAPYIGTSVPRKIPGRGIAMDADGDPVESQSYWTPDPRRALRDRKEGDLDILRSLLPAEVTHPRFDILIDDEDAATWIDENGKSTYTAWAAIVEAHFRTSAQADEIIDLDTTPDDQETGQEDTPAEQPTAARADRHLRLVTAEEEDEDDGYEPSTITTSDRLQEGDLVLLDDEWVVVESAIADLEDEGMISISWRTDDDDAGEIALDADETLTVRRAAEHPDEEDS
ncbi:hypothetical protein [Brachybacterium sp. sponge]|uniref:hypothetical protein n=1 Tax=Brachybacterium sp. sponge TaxID=1775432 RepID=UPI000A706218|nr:hypothetical protein [Brachybacterium sp. sponge]